MAVSKATEFSDRDNRIARYAKALGHPARVAILRLLERKNACYCGDIVEELPIAQATVSQHLKELKDAGLIQGEINPPKTCCKAALAQTQKNAVSVFLYIILSHIYDKR